MAFRNLTNLGKEYLAARLANELPVKFIKAKIGNGSVPLSTDPAQTTELYGFKKQVTILKAVQEQNSIKLTIQITNDGVNEGFYLKEIGIYVDDNGKEVLYWYCNEDNSQYINAQTDTPLSFEVDIMMEVTNINSAVVEWTGKDTWVNKEFLKDEVAKKLDKGAVSTEYDTAKKIEDKIKAVQRTADGKVSKTGDTMTGSLQIDVTNNHIELINNRTKIGTIKAEANTLTITNLVSKKVIQLTNTGSAYIQANNLETNEKEVVASINGLNGKKQDKLRKERILTASDNLDDVVEVGDYRCANIGIDKFSSAEIPINSYYGYGLLKVRSLQTNSIIQEYIPLNDNEGKRPRLYRFRWENPTNWSSWITILNYDSYPFLGALGTQYKITAIQKEGRKEAGQIYYDEVTGKIYKARISNNDKDVTSNFIDITNKGLSDKIESNNRKLLFSGGASTATIPKHILEKYDYLYIHLENTVSSKTPLPCFVEVEDLFSSNIDQLLFGVPNGGGSTLEVGIEYSQSTGTLKASGGYFTKIVGYKWYHRED